MEGRHGDLEDPTHDNPDARALVEMFCAELASYGDRHTELSSGAKEAVAAALADADQLCDQLGNALSLAGLGGQAAVCRLLCENFAALTPGTADGDITENTLALLQDWPEQLSQHLQGTGSGTQDPEALLNFLSRPGWPLPLTLTKRDVLRDQLAEVVWITSRDGEVIPAHADPQMASLALPEDFQPQLLEGLLHELPEQVRLFDQSIHNFLDSRVLADLELAQRMAHTIKGAANVVGIAGIANLMHYCEDLLESAAALRKTLPANFEQTLEELADCLASACEFLCGIGPEPDNLLQVINRLLDVIRELKPGGTPAPTNDSVEFDLSELDDLEASLMAEMGGDISLVGEFEPGAGELDSICAADGQTPGAKTQITRDEVTEANPAGERETVEHRFSVPESTAQQLLRIAGESQITNTRLLTHFEQLRSSIQLSERYHQQIKVMAAELETLVQTQTALSSARGSYRDGLDALELEHYNELHSFSNRLLELTTDSQEGISHLAQQISDLAEIGHGQKQLNRENQELLLKLRLVAVDTLAPRFSRCVRQAARLTGKPARLHIEGGALLVDSRILNRIADPIMHLLRNAVDHGLRDEPKAGEANSGQITLSFEHRGESVVIRCRDQGRGLDVNGIRNKALQLGLLDPNAEADEIYLQQLIFLPGFSTREKVSQTSGRGIGLDAVQEEVRALRGQITVHSEPDRGCCFEITVPASILTAHTLLVRCGASMLSLLSHNVERIVYLEENQRQLAADYEDDEEQLPLVPLEDLTGLHSGSDTGHSALLIVRKTDGLRVAVAVPGVLASQDAVVKPLNAFSFHPDGVIGATITGAGIVSPVIDLQTLPGMSLTRDELTRHRRLRSRFDSEDEDKRPSVLIVDDSLSARRSLAQFVADMGMEAALARDGFEAIHLLSQERPALILADMEMPRMNGLELTTHLRAQESTRQLPVVMITSRSTEKHRQMAREAGVNAYLTKPWSEDDLMEAMTSCLAGG